VSIEGQQAAGQIPDDPQLGQLLTRATELQASIEANKLDQAGLAEVKEQLKSVKADIDKWQEERNAAAADEERKGILADLASVKQALADYRTPSKAHLIGSPQAPTPDQGHFFSLVAHAKSTTIAGSIERMQEAKASLDAMGSFWAGPDPAAKATVGDTDAAGGYLVPNNVVSRLNEQATPARSVVDLFTVITDVRGSAVDIPWEDSNTSLSRAVIAAAGATKENKNLIVNNYTATLYTLARIFDVGNQLLRQSQGAAEQMVRSGLARAFGLGEDYYALQGSGSSEPYGLLTALGTSGTYVTSHTPSASTVAGNWAAGLAKAAGAVAQRGAIPDAAVFNSGDFWTNLASGADSAGFYVDPMGGGYNFNAPSNGTTGAGPWGIRVRHSPNMPTDSMVVGEFSAAWFFRGQGYRVDVSSEAGDRWDKNLTGFRGEEEIAFDARPFVYTGRFQRITNILP
jgi:HK97 family phage major capsid protein